MARPGLRAGVCDVALVRRRRGVHGPRGERADSARSEAVERIISVDDVDALDMAAEALAAGKVVVIPTDTVYGLAAVAHHRDAVERIFDLKSRPFDKPIAMLVSDERMAASWGDLSAAVQQINTGWPGALTVVVPRRLDKRQVFLGGDPSTVGLRVPDHPFVLGLIARVGPLAATSANPSGDATPEDVASIADSLPGADLFIDGGTLGVVPSRVISFIDGPRDLR